MYYSIEAVVLGSFSSKLRERLSEIGTEPAGLEIYTTPVTVDSINCSLHRPHHLEADSHDYSWNMGFEKMAFQANQTEVAAFLDELKSHDGKVADIITIPLDLYLDFGSK